MRNSSVLAAWVGSLALLGLPDGLQAAAQQGSTWPPLSDSPRGVDDGSQDAAVVIAIEHYQFLTQVPGALRNAEAWHAYLSNTRGIAKSRIAILTDADATDYQIREVVRTQSKTVQKGGKLWFVFIGHGAPNAQSTEGLLVAVDAQQTAAGLEHRSLPVSELIRTLEHGRGTPVVVIDACFSGRDPARRALVSGLQPSQVVAPPAPTREAVVLTAARSDQYAGSLPQSEPQRPAFSYLVLGALRGWADDDGDGRVTAEEVAAYAQDVLRVTLRGQRSQTPELRGNGSLVLSTGGERGPDYAAVGFGSVLSRADGAPVSSPSPNALERDTSTASEWRGVQRPLGESVQFGVATSYGIYTGDDQINSPDPYGLGLGMAAGYTFRFGLYAGAELNYFFGGGKKTQDPDSGVAMEASWRVMQYGAELGYDIGLGTELVLRPKVGIGGATASAEATLSAPGVDPATDSGHDTALMFPMGAQLLYSPGFWFLGAQARYAVFSISGEVPDSSTGTMVERTSSLSGLLLGAAAGGAF